MGIYMFYCYYRVAAFRCSNIVLALDVCLIYQSVLLLYNVFRSELRCVTWCYVILRVTVLSVDIRLYNVSKCEI